MRAADLLHRLDLQHGVADLELVPGVLLADPHNPRHQLLVALDAHLTDLAVVLVRPDGGVHPPSSSRGGSQRPRKTVDRERALDRNW
ncbi:hypothetical protein E1264_28790 [Actinomadura sp. KC216]|uniref:hypothetical protein n=1 Tax=Actinomadura sp. KC216 TaxID=2530370 RepID=UPI00105008E4|nr:hypothetical protein [Actinomadura sp. KC216]TDB83357.1 hypothetical protein E1264_28790 [Actinomadura sp. KC216]